jgi:hypothetical protein
VLKFFSGVAILLLALFLQLFLVSAGWYFNLALATLIAFAFDFDFWELLVFDLFTVFILNWKPAPSVALLIFALVPLAAFAFRKLVNSERWIGNLIAIFVGFLVFYLVSAPAEFLPHFAIFLADLIIGLALGQVIFFAFSI